MSFVSAPVTIQLPDGLTAEAYSQKAFSDALKIAGLYDESSKNRLTGSITIRLGERTL